MNSDDEFDNTMDEDFQQLGSDGEDGFDVTDYEQSSHTLAEAASGITN